MQNNMIYGIKQSMMNAMNNNQMMSVPAFQKAVGLYRNHDTKSLTQLAENVCKEYGTSYEEQKQKLGF